MIKEVSPFLLKISVTIKSKKDLKEKLQKGIDDINANRIYSLDESFAKIEVGV